MNKEIIISCEKNVEDLAYLRDLLVSNNIDVRVQTQNILHSNNSMGLEEVLVVFISSSIIPQILETINVWLSTRKKDIKIIDKKSGKELHITSYNGKCLSDKDVESFKKLLI